MVGRKEEKASYFQPHEGFWKEHSLSYATEERHPGRTGMGRKEPVYAICNPSVQFFLSSCISCLYMLMHIAHI